MFRSLTRGNRLDAAATRLCSRRADLASGGLRRQLSSTSRASSSIPLQIHGRGSGTVQTVSVKDKAYDFRSDTYTVLGGQDSAPSPVAYSLASLSACSQVTGSVVAKDHGIALGAWEVGVRGVLPTAVLVGGEEGNANWESVEVEARVQTDADNKAFEHFTAEVERRCPITQLFKRSGVEYKSRWVNEPLK